MAPHDQEFRIVTTDECIKRAKRHSFHWCVYALSIASSIPLSTRIRVDAQYTKFNLDGYRYTFHTPVSIAERAAAFDRGVIVKHWPDTILKEPTSVVPSVKRGPAERSGKHAKKRPERKCSKKASRRWHGIKIGRRPV